MENKKCCRCAVVKPMSDYYAGGGACKLCTTTRRREQYVVRPPEQVERKRNNLKSYAQRNRPRINERAAIQRTTPQFKEWRETYRERTKEQRNAHIREYYVKNREQIAAYRAEWQRANPDKCWEYYQRYMSKPGNRERDRANSKRERDRLTDGYIRTILSMRTPLKSETIPQAMVEAKRVQLQITRRIKDATNPRSQGQVQCEENA
jgi:hypothetical protein